MSRLDPNQRRSPAAAIRLGARHDLPPRVLACLQGVLDHCKATFGKLLEKVLNEAERQLFALAEKSTSSQRQEHALEGLREIKRKRADVAPILLQMIEDALARFDHAAAVTADAETTRQPRAKPELSLVENSELEPALALQEIEARHALRHSQQLHALGYRFGVLAAAPAFDAESLPIGPATLCAGLRASCAGMNLATEYRVLLYRIFDHLAINEIDALYRQLNHHLAKSGILPYLRIGAAVARSGTGSEAANAGSAPAAATTAPEAATEEAATATAASATTTSAAAATSSAATGAATASPGAAATADAAPPASSGDIDLLASLRELLASRRPPSYPAGTRADGRAVPVVSLDDLQAALHEPAHEFGDGLGRSVRALAGQPAAAIPKTADQIRLALQKKAHQLNPYAPLPQLAPEHADTIDLIDLLMQQVKQTVPRNAGMNGLIDQLHAPMLRVALDDESFFTERAHPARLLLNTLVDASLHWRDENGIDPDPVLADKIQWVLHDLNGAQQVTPQFLKQLHEDVTKHLQTLERKAEIAERRAIDASQGHERVETARRTATTAIGERIARHPPLPKLLLTLLEQPWTDALTLTLLRHGVDSEEYRRRLRITDSVLESSVPGAPPPPAEMRQEIEEGLGQVGMYPEDIQAIGARLFTHRSTAAGEPSEKEAAAAEALSEKLEVAAKASKKAQSKPGEAAARIAATVPLNAIERQILSHLKTLAFGTWFEFVTNQQGDSVRRKLAWFSTLSGTCLFVNARGVRVCERSFEQVARDMARNQIRLCRPQRESMIDRALKSVWDKLRQLGGRKEPSLPLST